VFAKPAGYAWNQEPAALLALLAFLVHARGVVRASVPWCLLGGALLGVAIAIRITYAPLVAAFILAFWLAPATRGRRVALVGSLAGGLAIGLMGLVVLFLSAPEQTFFGNFEFAKVNITYRFSTGEPRTMTLLKKVRYVVKGVIRPDAGLALAFAMALAWLFVFRRTSRQTLSVPLRFLLVTLPFLLAGSLAPSPIYEQYFYPFAFFLPLGAAYALSLIPSGPLFVRATGCAFAAIALGVGMGMSA
jgi:hypothetical protein